jgi:hypothetical protein
VDIDICTHTSRRLYAVPKSDAREKVDNVQTIQGGWGIALVHAQKALDRSRARTRLLKTTVQKLQEKVDAGEPFPAQHRLDSTRRVERKKEGLHVASTHK